jgi:hypothetical protein
MINLEQFKIEVSHYGDIEKWNLHDDGIEMVVRNKTSRTTTYLRLYETYLSSEYKLASSCFEPSYYKSYYLKKK